MENIFEEEKMHEEPEPETLYRPAGFFIRFFSYIIDLIIIASLTNILFGRLYYYPESGFQSLTGISFATVGIIGSLYFLLMTGFFGQTIGKMITGIEVIGTDGQRPDWLSLFFREIIGRFISQLGGLHAGYIWIALHPHKQGWHDKFGDSYVVHKDDSEENRYIKI